MERPITKSLLSRLFGDRPFTCWTLYLFQKMSYQGTLANKPKRFSTYSYIEKEFFNADRETLSKITDLYYDLYGYGPHKYLLDTYQSWKSGYVSTSGQTMGRIIKCVPRYLSDEKRFFILKNEVIYFIETLHQKQQNKNISLSELNTLFENYATPFENFNQSNLPYMDGKKIFTPEEIEQFLLVCKYALLEKLNLAYRQVQNDLVLFKEKISSFNTGVFKASYQIDFLNSKIDISNINEVQFDFIKLKKPEINPNGTYKQFAEQYILEEFMQMNFSEKEGAVNHFVKSQDLDFFLDQYHQIKRKENEATLKSDFKGEGGQLSIVLEVKSLHKIKLLIFLSATKMIIYFAILIIAIFLIVKFELYKIVILLILGGFILGGILLENFKSEIQTIKNLKLDLKRYGQ